MRTRRRNHSVLRDKTPRNTENTPRAPKRDQANQGSILKSLVASDGPSKQHVGAAAQSMAGVDDRLKLILTPAASARRLPLGTILVQATPSRHSSDEDESIINSPSPVRPMVRAALASLHAQSTPSGPSRRRQRLPLRPLASSPRRQSVLQKRNIRQQSPLPPSSPPSSFVIHRDENFAMGSRAYIPYPDLSEEDEDKENIAAAAEGSVYVYKDESSEDDPFGFFAAEKKLKAMRERHQPRPLSTKYKGKERAGTRRAPLGEILPAELSSLPAPIPTRIPTPTPVDEHNIDDLYIDIDPVCLPSPAETLHTPLDDDKENAPPIAPLLLAEIAAEPEIITALSSPSSEGYSDPLRTPHKHRSAHERDPLSSPHFSSTTASPSPLDARSVRSRSSSPSPVKPLSALRFVPGSLRRESQVRVAESSAAGRKRKRAQNDENDENDENEAPTAAASNLDKPLPERRSKRTSATARGRGGRGAKAARVDSESENDEQSEVGGRRQTRNATGRGRGRGGGRGRGRGRGRGKTTAASGRVAAGKGKGKGKEKAGEYVDLEEDEERARERKARIEYFRKLDKEYSLEKEDVYVI